MQYDKSVFQECLRLIEVKLGWGASNEWSNADFEMLSEKMGLETGVNLSTSTLKRLWGKVKYESVPQVATLNALARFAGYESYKELETANRKNSQLVNADATFAREETFPISIPSQINTPPKRPLSSSTFWSIGLVMGMSLSLFLAFSLRVKQKRNTKINPASFAFSSRPVSKGIPNTVVFTFDALAAPTDCVYIQQSWDQKLRFKVDKEQKEATSIYYYPGFFKAKLIVGGQIVKEQNLLIKSDGWLSLVEQNPVPVYFTRDESIKNGILSLSEGLLEKSNINLQPVVPWLSFYYVEDFNNLSGESFTLETGLKNTYTKGSGACGESQLIVLCESDIFAIPLSIPGCTSTLDAYFAGKQLPGTQTDLSSLGVDFSKWVKLRLEVKNRAVQVLINDKLAIQSKFFKNAGKVKGIVYRFQGTGAVDYLHVFNEQGKEIFKEEFNK